MVSPPWNQVKNYKIYRRHRPCCFRLTEEPIYVKEYSKKMALLNYIQPFTINLNQELAMDKKILIFGKST